MAYQFVARLDAPNFTSLKYIGFVFKHLISAYKYKTCKLLVLIIEMK